ncbi:MAG: response regulator [Leptolyngbya sp. DLM2.Bin15]|nr:MAG: response regulator [Leptolyngbya sp. DLM2.Bin15]
MSIEILLVEDSPSDADLAIEALRKSKVLNHVHVVEDGVEAIAFVRHQGDYINHPRPDLILLDLNLPRKNGREVLAELKSDPDLASIPIIVLTTSSAEEDIRSAYSLHANCYLIKPVNLEQFMILIKAIEDFWLAAVKLPPRRT